MDNFRVSRAFVNPIFLPAARMTDGNGKYAVIPARTDVWSIFLTEHLYTSNIYFIEATHIYTLCHLMMNYRVTAFLISLSFSLHVARLVLPDRGRDCITFLRVRKVNHLK